jgi:hypothetical protein
MPNAECLNRPRWNVADAASVGSDAGSISHDGIRASAFVIL